MNDIDKEIVYFLHRYYGDKMATKKEITDLDLTLYLRLTNHLAGDRIDFQTFFIWPEGRLLLHILEEERYCKELYQYLKGDL